jgi:hypothetical protein
MFSSLKYFNKGFEMSSVINFLMAVELYKVIHQSNLIPNEDIRMHVNAILAGNYSLNELLSAAPS